MNYRIILILLFVSVTSAYSQNEPAGVCTCTVACSQSQLDVIRNSWSDFEGPNLDSSLPLVLESIQHPVVNIKLDGIGCVYPPFVNDVINKDDFLDKSLKAAKYHKFTFFNVFQKNGASIIKSLRAKGYYENILKELELLTAITAHGNFAVDIFNFRKRWNDLFLPPVIDQINKITKEQNIQKSFWFVHGFNVPYSLAHLQSNHIFRKIASKAPVSNKMLFVRIYWPSESAKKISEKPPLKYKNTRAPRTPWKYLYVANRSYLGGLALRQVFSKISPTLDINMISHSHGAAMVAASLINPKSQIKSSDRDTPLNSQLIHAFDSINMNNQARVTVFMSAPGMPGETTFSDLDPQINGNHYFYVGHNHRDKILRKGPFSARLSSTTLGCDWKGEIQKTTKVFADKKMPSHFIPRRAGHQREHDMFCYTAQNGFNDLFSNYLNDCFSTSTSR